MRGGEARRAVIRPAWSAAVPNALTLARLVLAPLPPAAAWLLAPGSGFVAAAALFTLLALSDAADGALARFLAAESRFGAALDPIADKALVLGGLLAVAATPAGAALWFQIGALLIAAREIGRGALRLSGRVGAPGRAGKLKTALQCAALVALLSGAGAAAAAPLGALAPLLAMLGPPLFLAATAATLASLAAPRRRR